MYRVLQLLVKGLIFGNIFALLFYFLQKYFSLLKLNPDVYYLNKVPVDLPFWVFIAVNLLSVLVCWLALWIPTFVISRISPSKNLRFS